MDLYLGRPGTLLTKIRSPKPGVDRSPDGGEQVAQLLGGGQAVDRAPNPSRTREYVWTWDSDTHHVLQAFHGRQYGPGPFALIDPGQINYLLPNQASPANVTSDATGFAVVPGSSETIAASTTMAFQGPRSLLWTLPSSPTGAILTFSAPAPLVGWPLPSATWSLSIRVRLGAGDSAVDLAAALRWLDATGAQVSETVGTTVTAGTSAWSLLTVTAPPPATAVYLTPRLKATAATITSTAGVHVGQAQLQIGPVSAWRPGEGPNLVSIAKLREVAQLTTDTEQRHDIALTLADLALEV